MDFQIEKGLAKAVIILSVITFSFAQLQIASVGVGGVNDVLDCGQQFQQASQNPNADIGLKPQIITKYGYPVETHNVTTDDGYILTVFRIPYSPKSPLVDGVKKKAIYLNHGLGGNSQNWLFQYGDNNLAFLLSDAGFDVFLSNCRGTSYSPGHVNLTQSDIKYWDFSWHEMGVFDVPAVMKMILNVTQTPKMYYAGHSMGTTQYFIAMSTFPESNKQIYTAFLLAPIAFLFHTSSVVRLLVPLAYDSQYLFNPILGGKLSTSSPYSEKFQNYTGLSLRTLCAQSAFACTACANGYFFLYGYDGPQVNYTSLGVAISVSPDVSSTKEYVHYAQSMDTECLGSLITVHPVRMKNAMEKDVEITASQMDPNSLKELNLLPWKQWTHIDFVLAKGAKGILYDSIKNIMINGTYITNTTST